MNIGIVICKLFLTKFNKIKARKTIRISCRDHKILIKFIKSLRILSKLH